MKSTGIVRAVDELGRIVLPKEMRKKMNISPGDPLEIFVDGSRIILAKSTDVCVFCGKEENLGEFRGKKICTGCKEELLGAKQS